MKPTKCDEGQVNQTFYSGVRGQTEGKFEIWVWIFFTMGMSSAVAEVPANSSFKGAGGKLILCCFLIEGNDFYQLLFTSWKNIDRSGSSCRKLKVSALCVILLYVWFPDAISHKWHFFKLSNRSSPIIFRICFKICFRHVNEENEGKKVKELQPVKNRLRTA